ncbi:hypothetical protein PC118_g6992 [Phytophthora cactorum]|uniref:Uncharacterized protein n=1 Tax=Phytophthora cactorum TaxID=29920 RepID=A0A8T1G6X5_9STRA|nr:hypothetical protein PC111_g15417 [Phytophthora cactorum]KAG2845755.1 hypothetical protein PC113_g18114 [Phytophthora cactorum]KAG2987962.1 hypothetical protein PC118_g6992 [Phytophthora cactorum]KAG2989563.1 hypothetical protein PC119_g19276 [Phytophthora cactorum]KAG3198240.1 hypothetical protein PC128_g6197 [Phytophthora cactorum]
MMLYRYGSDLKILNATSLTRSTDLRSTSFVTVAPRRLEKFRYFGQSESPRLLLEDRFDDSGDPVVGVEDGLRAVFRVLGVEGQGGECQ